MGFDVPKGLTPQQSVILNEAEGDMPSESDVAQANDIELQEIAKSVVKSTEDLIVQFEGEEMLPMWEL